MKRTVLILKNLYIMLFLLLGSIAVTGATDITQNKKNLDKDSTSFIEITGRVVDKNTEEPLVFATLGVMETSIGTVSNLDGEFIFKIPLSVSANKIFISYLGYKKKLIPINELKEKFNIIKLEPFLVKIDEVIVRKKDPLQLIKMAKENIKQNYNVNPEQQIAFYRETIKKNKNYIAVAEAVLNVYKSSYQSDFENDRVKIYKGRKSSDVKRMDTILFKLQGGPRTSYLLDVVKNPGEILSENMVSLYDYSFDKISSINNREVYIINFTPKKFLDMAFYTGKIYIDIETLAFVGINFKLNPNNLGSINNVLVKKKPVKLRVNVKDGNYLVTYKELNGEWYLSHVRSEMNFKCKWKKQLFYSNYTTTIEMVVTDRDENDVEKYKFKESAKISDVLTDKINYFEEDDFWGAYNTIKPDESIESAILKISKKLKLED